MAKIADTYFSINPWKIIEDGFCPDYSEVAESVFSLGNEYMGIRGFMEEGYGGDTLIGSYFNGIYERTEQKPSYKGIAECTEYMVNSVNWLAMEIEINGETLDVHYADIENFQRVLDMRNGILTRTFQWNLSDGKKVEITFERFLLMEKSKVGVQKISMTPLNFTGDAKVTMGLDFSVIHKSRGENVWTCDGGNCDGRFMEILGTTKVTGQQVYSCCKLFGDDMVLENISKKEKQISVTMQLALTEGKTASVGRIAYNVVQKTEPGHTLYEKSRQQFENDIRSARKEVETYNYETLKEENRRWWKAVWDKSDIVIDGDEMNQQGIRFCIFQMYQTYHGTEPGTNIGAKGLTGEAYSGNAFWDTETYCLPFYLFHDLNAAKNLLMFRYLTLEEARCRAKALDCKGAFYPIATISGKECCTLWQHASLQLQASTAVAYGIWFYHKLVKDTEFLLNYGLEMLVEISRMLATRGDYTEGGKKYSYYCVMGPDEFQMMVNHNFYTNYMAKFTLEYTLEVIRFLKQENKEKTGQILSRLNVTEEEFAEWSRMVKYMYFPRDEEKGLFEQHEGFFRLPHVDVDAIPIEDFPLYHHWSYDRIYRNDMIKQPDVLMTMLLFNSEFTTEQIKKHYEYYEPKCIHESSLSPSVHSILASQLKKHEEAYEFFGFATRLDLDNYNRNTREGLHTTSIAAAWMNIVYGFGGMRSDGELLRFNPSIPKQWNFYSFRIIYQGEIIEITVEKDRVRMKAGKDRRIKVMVYDKETELSEEEVIILIPKEWR